LEQIFKVTIRCSPHCVSIEDWLYHLFYYRNFTGWPASSDVVSCYYRRHLIF